MKRIAIGFCALSLIVSTPVMAADMAVKAMAVKAPVAAPVSWTGFYAGAEIGGAWSQRGVNYTPNDPVAARRTGFHRRTADFVQPLQHERRHRGDRGRL